MLSLYELQKQFTDNLRNNSSEILNFVLNNSLQNIEIYQSSTFGALQKVLKEIYPVCLKLVGEEFFIAMIEDFIIANPSLSPDIGEYGKSLPDYIANFEPAEHLPYLADVAKLEWAWHQIYDAADNTLIDFDKLSSCYASEGENIQFTLSHNSTLLFSSFPIHRIWEINQDDYAENETVTLQDNQQFYYFIWRNELEMRIDLLTQAEWQMLSWSQAGYTLGDIAERIETLNYEIDFSEILVKATQCGWFCGFELRGQVFI